MKPSDSSPGESDGIDSEAARWVLRHDRGLSAGEQDAYSQWLASDSRHREAIARMRWGWDELDRLAGIQAKLGPTSDPDLLAPDRARPGRARAYGAGFFRHPWISAAVAAAAVIAACLGAAVWHKVGSPPRIDPLSLALLAPPCEQRTLEDGSTVVLNRGANVAPQFTAAERRVDLSKGEAHFSVTRNPARPFIVLAKGVEVRAVGTAFDVRLDADSVEIVVTEGHVRVTRQTGTDAGPCVVDAVEGQCADVGLRAGAPPPRVSQLAAAEVEARLAWRPRLLDFTGVPLREIAAEFNRHNSVKLIVADPTLQSLRLTASFRSDNLESFVRLMESDFGMEAGRGGESDIVLRKRQ